MGAPGTSAGAAHLMGGEEAVLWTISITLELAAAGRRMGFTQRGGRGWPNDNAGGLGIGAMSGAPRNCAPPAGYEYPVRAALFRAAAPRSEETGRCGCPRSAERAAQNGWAFAPGA